MGTAATLIGALQACSAAPEESPESTESELASGINVVTQHNDVSRTGANLAERRLTTSSVTPQKFGKVFSRAVDGQIYAQPLYVGGVGGKNVVYVATEHNSVYAFDADGSSTAPLWRVNFGPSVPAQDTGCGLVSPEIGITSTPVIDTVTSTLYVVAKTKEHGAYVHRLHALDLATGAEKAGSPAVIHASVPGTGDGSVNGTITLDPLKHLNRPGLLLTAGTVYVAFGSNCDIDPYHGWVLGYDAATLQQKAVYANTPNGSEGGIWQAGAGLNADADGNVYFVGGNGTFTQGGKDLGSSIVKLAPGEGGLSVSTSFTPANFQMLNAEDLDIGSMGALLVPGTNLLLAAGKQGIFYLVNRDAMGGVASGDRQIVQRFQGTTAQIWGSPAYWARTANPRMYVWGQDDHLKSYRFNGATFDTAPSVNTQTLTRGYPGGQLSLSADGDKAGTGILWTSHVLPGGGGIVQAFDADDVTHELWNSRANATRDDVGTYARYAPPTIANGRVYVPSFSNKLVVYGLLTAPVGTDAGTPHDASPDAHDAHDAGSVAPTWSAVYGAFFGPSTPGHCGNSGCHQVTRANFKCGTSKTACYNGLVSAGLVNPSSPRSSVLGDPTRSPLSWFGGGMPADQAVSNPRAAAAVTAWLAAGAQNN